MIDEYDYMVGEFSPVPSAPLANPTGPHGGRAAVGATAGIVLGSLVGLGYQMLRDRQKLSRHRSLFSWVWMLTVPAGAALFARPDQRMGAALGSAGGVLVSAALSHPSLFVSRPLTMHALQWMLPVGGALLGANLVS